MIELKPFTHNIEDYPDGIVLVVDKPYRWTSADVVRKVKWLACRHFGKKNLKVGHAGTLDPLATGVLMVCIGNATKRAEALQARDKEYIAGISFGATTPSYDLEKEIDCRFSTDNVNEASVRTALKDFTGEQEQIAPLFSAKSIDGVRAYELARKLYKRTHVMPGSDRASQSLGFPVKPGMTLTPGMTSTPDAPPFPETNPIRPARIRIDALELLSYSESGHFLHAPNFDPDYTGMTEEEIQRAKEKNSRINVVDARSLGLPVAEVHIACTKGTYIRAFARDLGEALDSGAFLSYLIRTRSGDHSLSDALSIHQVRQLFQ